MIFDFGLSSGEESVNNLLAARAKMLVTRQNIYQVYAQTLTYGLLPDAIRSKAIELVSNGSRGFGQKDDQGSRGDSYEVLEQLVEQLGEEKEKPVILIAQVYHAMRIRRQAAKLGLTVILPLWLPKAWSRKDPQFWVRNWFFWCLREFPAQIAMHILRKI